MPLTIEDAKAAPGRDGIEMDMGLEEPPPVVLVESVVRGMAIPRYAGSNPPHHRGKMTGPWLKVSFMRPS